MLASHKLQFKECTEQLMVRGNMKVSSAKRTLWTVSFLIYLLNHRKQFPAHSDDGETFRRVADEALTLTLTSVNQRCFTMFVTEL